jgi:hypothetical protein
LLRGLFPVLPLGFLLAFCFLLDVFGGRADQRLGLGEVVAQAASCCGVAFRSPASW